MSDNIEMSKNHTALARCNRIYKYVFIISFPVCAAIMVYSLFMLVISLLSAEIETMFVYLIAGFLLCPASFIMTVYSGYSKNDLFSYLSLLPVSMFFILIAVLSIDDYSGIYLCVFVTIFLTVISVPLTLAANAKYRYLEDQEGFPHFSPLLHEQQVRSEELKDHDPYAEAAKRRKLTASDSMKGLKLSCDTLEEKIIQKNTYMDEI